MRKRYTALFIISITLLITACGGKQLPNTDFEVANQFIKDIQQLDFKNAEQLMLIDETNLQYLERFEKHFRSRPKEELDRYRDATIIINEQTNVSDSVSIINYSNSFNKEEKNKLKLVRSKGQWLVDLKYTFSGNM